MRADPQFGGIGQYLERLGAALPTYASSEGATIQDYYKIQNRLPATSNLMFRVKLDATESGAYGCTTLPGDPHPDYANWCGNEAQLVAGAAQRLAATTLAGCTLGATRIGIDRSNDPPHEIVDPDPANPQRGVIRLGNGYDEQYRTYATDAVCPGANGSAPTSRTVSWTMLRHKSFLCQSGFVAELAAPAIDGNYCAPSDKRIVVLSSPVSQVCCNAPGSGFGPSPDKLNPVTGDKVESETDFDFAGRPFKRYYHSTRQFRSNPQFAEAWTHSYTDRIAGFPGSSMASTYDETGHFEVFSAIGGNRYRGQVSSERLLEYLPTPEGPVRWRLREPDGEYREFDGTGKLVAVRNPAAPLSDVRVAYANGAISTATDGQGRILRFEYANRLLARIVKPDGTAVVYGYDEADNLTSVDYGNAQVKHYHYHEAGLALAKYAHLLTGITSETGKRYATFGYDDQGRIVSSRLLGSPNALTTVAYDSDVHSTVSTAEGATQGYAFEPGLYRRITEVDTSGQGTARQSFDSEGRVQSATDREGALTHYEYDPDQHDVVGVVEGVGKEEQRRTEMTRDPITRQLTERRVLDGTGALVAKTNWTYNARRQVTSTTATDPATNAVRTISIAYCEAEDVAVAGSVCPVLGLIKTVDGPLPDTVDFADVTRYEYRPSDSPVCAVAPTACPWRKGDLWRTTNAKGHVIEVLAYDGAGRAISVKRGASANDANAVTTDIEYAPRGWAVARKERGADGNSEADDRISRVEYLADGTVQRVFQPDGTYATLSYDDAGRLVGIADSGNNSVSYTLNAVGERVKEETRDADGGLQRTLSRTFDTLGQLQASTDADGHSTMLAYDREGRLTNTTDPLTRQATRTYDALGRLTRSLENATDSAASAETLYRYDPMDRIIRITDPNGNNTDYRYDGFGGLLELKSPDTGTTSFGYDEAGNLIDKVDANNKHTQYRYDALNRLKMVDYAAAVPDESFVYDVAMADCPAGENFAVGRLTRMVDASGFTHYCYNRFGDLTRKVQYTGARKFTTRWVYLANGRLQKMVYPGNAEVDYVYDSQGRIAEIGMNRGTGRQVLLGGATYYPFGPVRGWSFGNGLQLRRTFNRNYQPDTIEDGPEQGASVGLSLGYAFDEIGNLKSLRNSRQAGAAMRSYGYDGMNRLTEVRDASGVVLENYRYDRTGNRLSAGEWTVADAGGGPGGGGTPTYAFRTVDYTYEAESHRLIRVGDEPRTYDAAGNLKDLGSPSAPGGVRRHFAYNEGNRMSEVSHTSTLATYLYNGKGERVRRTAYGIDTFTVYDPQGHWLGDFSSAGTPEAMAIWFGDLPVGLLVGAGSSQKLFYVEADALGSPRAVLDPTRGSQGTVVWRWDPGGEAFGKDYPNEDPDGDGLAFNLDLRFPGQQFDAVTGMHYNYFRDYDPATGRYVESDPIGLEGGVSTYSYVRSAPLSLVDPLGLVDLNYAPLDDKPNVRNGYEYIQSRDGELTIGVHFDGKNFLLPDGRYVPPSEFAIVVKEDLMRVKRKFNYITLISCRTAVPAADGKIPAQVLSDILGVVVQGADLWTWTADDPRAPFQGVYGKIPGTNNIDRNNKGKFIPFFPRRRP